MKTPRLYATFLLWMLAQLFDKLPEVGDPDKPKLVFFFDEAHLLFNEAPKALLEQVERVTRLIRSRGVGVYYVTQNPRDVPNNVSAQLGNRIQHALRAFTPIEQKGIKAAAETFRPNPKLDTTRVIQELKVGEALVSMLHGGGEPSMVQRTLIRPPSGRIGPVTPDERKAKIEASPVYGKYEEMVDRESAYEILQKKAKAAADKTEADQNSWGNHVWRRHQSAGRLRRDLHQIHHALGRLQHRQRHRQGRAGQRTTLVTRWERRDDQQTAATRPNLAPRAQGPSG
jgi:DNA helicase HerA-like ATPase